MKKIIQTEHTCSKCQRKFQAATLGDFVYGEFLLWSEPDNCLYLNVFEDQTFDEVINLINENLKLMAIETEDVHLLIQAVYGELACDVDERGQPYKMGNSPCPNCGSTSMEFVASKSVGEVFVNLVTHRYWESLTQPEKLHRLLIVLSQQQAGVRP